MVRQHDPSRSGRRARKAAVHLALIAVALASCRDQQQTAPGSTSKDILKTVFIREEEEPATSSCPSAPAVNQSARGGPKFFVLGVWVQPIDKMEIWKTRGVNTLVEIPQGHDRRAWVRAANQKGLFQIRPPADDLDSDLNDAYLLAWSAMDEPSNTKVGRVDYGWVAQEPKDVEREAAPWRARARAAGKFVPIWTNHVGPHIFPDWAQRNAIMRDYMEGQESDWLAADSYPIQAAEPFVIRSNDGYTSTTQGITLDRQSAWSKGKPIMTFIGTSAFNPNSVVPTAGQFNAMAWSSVIHGASGVIYFPVQLPPAWSFDATPPHLVAAIEEFNRKMAEIGPILMDPTSGGRRSYALYCSANEGELAQAQQLPYPFEAAEIATPDGPFRIVLNLSAAERSLDKPHWGFRHSVFPPFGVRMMGPDAHPPGFPR